MNLYLISRIYEFVLTKLYLLIFELKIHALKTNNIEFIAVRCRDVKNKNTVYYA